ncbi:MAG: YitT family protein [Spirochaetes bacterium]|nr:YitT family protein [Spirochaetota bacterium]
MNRLVKSGSANDLPGLKIYFFRIICITAGGMLSSLAVILFFYPHRFLSGGISGIALILDYTLGFPVSATLLLMNIPILILAFIELDLHFVISSIIGLAAYSFFLHIFRPLSGALYVPDEILAAIFGGALNGLGLGLIFKNRASIGGTDVISTIVRKKLSINIGTGIFLMNVVSVSIGAFFFPLYKAMYSLISMFVTSFLIDQFIQGFEKRFSVMIISEKWEKIAEYVTDNLYRGATILEGHGAYRRRPIKIIYTVIPSHRLSKLKDAVALIDPAAFMSVELSSEIMGNWKQGYFSGKNVYKKD